jgi:hypothetical protein
MQAGQDVDGTPVSVRLTRFAFAEPHDVEICAPEIELRCLGPVDAANAVSLSTALMAASQMARRAAGQPDAA